MYIWVFKYVFSILNIILSFGFEFLVIVSDFGKISKFLNYTLDNTIIFIINV